VIFVKKKEKGLYDVRDILGSHYFVEDSRRKESLPPDFNGPEWASRDRWVIWSISEDPVMDDFLEQSGYQLDELEFLASESTMQECLALIGMWCAAAQIGD